MNSLQLIEKIEKKFFKNELDNSNVKEKFKIGDIIRIGYLIPEGNKERTQFYEGLIIAKKNRGFSKTFTLRRSVQGIGIEQIFLENSPKLVSILKKQSFKVRRAKLYFVRSFKNKGTKLKKIA
jgi:large subunit ribosomal protein L19